MLFSRLKISTKLIISSAVFLIPVGVMIFLLSSNTLAAIRKNRDEQEGIASLRPVLVLFRAVPRYMNVFLGFEPGDPAQSAGEVEEALRNLEAPLERYGSGTEELRSRWETLRSAAKDDPALFTSYLELIGSLRETVTLIGERSSLILVSEIGNYYFVDTALSAVPEAVVRLSDIGNRLWKGDLNAQASIDAWNEELLASQARGRMLRISAFTAGPEKMPVSMLPEEDRTLILTAGPLLGSDRDRIFLSLKEAEKNSSGLDPLSDLEEKRAEYQSAAAVLLDQYGRLFGYNNPNPTTVREMAGGVSAANAGLCRLWSSVLNQMDLLTERNITASGQRMAVYLIIVLLSVLLAFTVVVLSTLDINRSVKSLRTLFTGLNENDLTLALEVNSGDEFGELMTAFNGFLDILKSTFGSFKQSAQLVADSVFDLSSSAKEITTTANEQSASVSEIVTTMEGSKNLSEQIAAKTIEVAELAGQIQDLSRKGAELRTANQDMMEDIRDQNLKIIHEIRNLTDMINRIGEAIRIIDGIADQTKLIAFNASLEASSSGEAGARFSVVAAEIRRFADNVVESTREIKQKIEEVQGASQTLIAEANNGTKQIELGYERMSEQKTVFERIVDNSQSGATLSQQISNLSKQQELASSQIFTALKEISAGVKQFVTATASTSKTADSLNLMSEELKDRVNKYRTA